MEFEYEKHIRREMRKGCLMDILKKTAVGACIIGSITGGVYFGRSEQRKQDKLIHSYTETRDVPAKPYEVYSKKLMRDYPELSHLDIRDLNSELEEINGIPSENLKASHNIKLPVYDFSASAEKE